MSTAGLWGTAKNGWGITGVLLGTSALVNTQVDSRYLSDFALRSPPWAFLVAVAGILVLNHWQESLLLIASMGMQGSFLITHQIELTQNEWNLLVLRRLVLIAVCIWAAYLRSQLEQKHSEQVEQQSRLQSKLEQSLRASILAHEIRQPLSHVIIGCKLLCFRTAQKSDLPTKVRTEIRQIQQSAEEVDQLVGTVTRLLREDKKSFETIDVTSLVENRLKRWKHKEENSRIDIEFKSSMNHQCVHGDKNQLLIAIDNLLKNASDAANKNWRRKRRIQVSVTRKRGNVLVQVADSGKGLPSKKSQELLLESKGESGMGVGIMYVETIALGHSGELILGSSKQLGGAQICMRLPANPCAPSANNDKGWQSEQVQNR